MIDLVITHLTHPWGPPWTLETLGDHWRPLTTMPQNGQNDQNGTPGMGEMSYNQIDHI